MLESTYTLSRAKYLENSIPILETTLVTFEKWCLDLYAKVKWQHFAIIRTETNPTLRGLCEGCYRLLCEIEQIEFESMLNGREMDVDVALLRSRKMDDLFEAQRLVIDLIREIHRG